MAAERRKSVSRTIVAYQYNGNVRQNQSRIEQFLYQSGFDPIQIQTGEWVWKKGTGMMAAMQFLKIEYQPWQIVVSAWVSPGLGNATVSEMDLEGFFAIAAKKPLRNLLSTLGQVIC